MKQQDANVRNRLYMTKKGRVVEATGAVNITQNEHYVEAKDVVTGMVQNYAKRHLREKGYAKRQNPLSALAALI